MQHAVDEGPGHAGEWLAERGHSLTFCRFFELVADDEPIFPALSDFDGLLVLGGPMRADDEARFGWLGAEKRFLADVLRAGKITLGLGLGAQLLALALGGEVKPNDAPEIGFWTVRFSARSLEHPLLHGWPEKALVLHWHYDTLTVPPGATRLGMSAGCVTQGFVWGTGIVGLQFRPEMTREMVEQLLLDENHDAAEGQEFVETAAQIRARLKSVWKGRVLLETLLANMVALFEAER